MNQTQTRLDPQTGLLTVKRSNSGVHPFLRAGDVNEDLASAAKLAMPYKQSAWVSAAVKLVAGPISAAELKFTVDKRGGDQLLDDPETNALWEAPAESCGRKLAISKLLFASVGWKLLRGEVFWILDDTWLSPRMGKKSPIIVARPDRMREILDGGKKLIGWEFRDGAGGRHVLLPEQVISDISWNPYNDHRGLGEWEAAKVAADSDYAAAVFARNLSENNGDRGPIVVAKGGMPSDEQREQITAALRNKQRMARAGKFKAIFLAGDISVEDPKLQAVDTAFVAQRVENRHEIYAAFGVPMSMAEVMSSYSVGSASDRFRLIEDTCGPIANDLAAMIQEVENIRRNGMTGRVDVYAELSFANHSTMVEVRAERIDSASRMHDRGIPWSVCSEYYGLDLPDFPGRDVAWVDFGKAPYEKNLTTDNTESTDIEEAEEDEEKAVDELMTLFRSCNAVHVHEGCEGHALKALSEDEQVIYDAQMKARVKTANIFRNQIKRQLMAARTETLANLQKLEDLASNKQIDPSKGVVFTDIAKIGGYSLTFDLAKFRDGLLKLLLGTSENAYLEAGKGLFAEIGQAVSAWIKPSERVLEFLRERENLLSQASEKVWSAVRDQIDAGLSKGESIAKIAERVRGEFNNISRGRATSIAVTETTVAYESARHEAMVQAGIEWKKWLSSRDGRVRDSHVSTDGQIREVDAPFDVRGHEMLFPGDAKGPASEVINCRCLSIAIEPPEETDFNGNADDETIPY